MKKILSSITIFAVAIIILSACERNCECTKTTTIFATTGTTINTNNYSNNVSKKENCSDLNSIDTTYYQRTTIVDGDTLMITEPLHIINTVCE